MNLKDYSGLDDFDDGELRKAARFVTQAMVDAVPPSSACKHVFSPTFQAKMARLTAREKWMDIRQRWAKRIAIALLTLMVGAASWLSIDADARETFIHWVREVYENSIIYRFFNDSSQAFQDIPIYRPTWLPEGYRQLLISGDHTSQTIVYQRGEDAAETIIFDYRLYSSDTQIELMWEDTEYECLEVQVGEYSAYFYQSLDGSKANDLVWVNKSLGLIFSLNGYLDQNVMLHIAESIKL